MQKMHILISNTVHSDQIERVKFMCIQQIALSIIVENSRFQSQNKKEEFKNKFKLSDQQQNCAKIEHNPENKITNRLSKKEVQFQRIIQEYLQTGLIDQTIRKLRKIQLNLIISTMQCQTEKIPLKEKVQNFILKLFNLTYPNYNYEFNMTQIMQRFSFNIRQYNSLPGWTKFIKIVESYPYFRNLKKYKGYDIEKEKMEFKRFLIRLIPGDILNQNIVDVLDKIVYNPLLNIMSESQLNRQEKNILFPIIFMQNGQKLVQYYLIKTIFQNLKTKVDEDIEKLLEEMKEIHSETKLKQLRNYLIQYKIAQFFEQVDINLQKVYRIFSNCKFYNKALKYNQYCVVTQQIHLKLKLRNYLYKLQIKFDLWDTIENNIFNRQEIKLHRITEITFQKIKQIKTFVRSNFIQFYEVKFGDENLAQKLKKQLIEIMIGMTDNKLKYREIQQIVNNIINNPTCLNLILQDGELLLPNLKKIELKKQIREKSCLIEYKDYGKIDIGHRTKIALKQLQYIIFEGASPIDLSFGRQIINLFAQNPLNFEKNLFKHLSQNVQVSILLLSRIQKEIMSKIKANRQIQECISLYKLMEQKKVQKEFHRLLENVTDIANSFLKDYYKFLGQFNFDENGRLIQPKLQLTGLFQGFQNCFEGQLDAKIKKIQNSLEYQNYRKNFFHFFQRKKQQAVKILNFQIRKLMKESDLNQEIIQNFIREFQAQNFKGKKIEENRKIKSIVGRIYRLSSYEDLTFFLRAEEQNKRLFANLNIHQYFETLKDHKILIRLLPQEKQILIQGLKNLGISHLKQSSLINLDQKQRLMQLISQSEEFKLYKAILNDVNHDLQDKNVSEKKQSIQEQKQKIFSKHHVTFEDLNRDFTLSTRREDIMKSKFKKQIIGPYCSKIEIQIENKYLQFKLKTQIGGQDNPYELLIKDQIKGQIHLKQLFENDFNVEGLDITKPKKRRLIKYLQENDSIFGPIIKLVRHLKQERQLMRLQ